jgi:hypothetical protein
MSLHCMIQVGACLALLLALGAWWIFESDPTNRLSDAFSPPHIRAVKSGRAPINRRTVLTVAPDPELGFHHAVEVQLTFNTVPTFTDLNSPVCHGLKAGWAVFCYARSLRATILHRVAAPRHTHERDSAARSRQGRGLPLPLQPPLRRLQPWPPRESRRHTQTNPRERGSREAPRWPPSPVSFSLEPPRPMWSRAEYEPCIAERVPSRLWTSSATPVGCLVGVTQ